MILERTLNMSNIITEKIFSTRISTIKPVHQSFIKRLFSHKTKHNKKSENIYIVKPTDLPHNSRDYNKMINNWIDKGYYQMPVTEDYLFNMTYYLGKYGFSIHNANLYKNNTIILTAKNNKRISLSNNGDIKLFNTNKARVNRIINRVMNNLSDFGTEYYPSPVHSILGRYGWSQISVY